MIDHYVWCYSHDIKHPSRISLLHLIPTNRRPLAVKKRMTIKAGPQGRQRHDGRRGTGPTLTQVVNGATPKAAHAQRWRPAVLGHMEN